MNVGDTITWTNQDAAPHTATADDGSFDTGELARGQSGSHTFTTAGSFSYVCSIHPSMRATVTVAGDAAPSAPPTADPTAPATPAAPTADTGSGLPDTGLDVLVPVGAGALLLAAGLLLRARTRPR